MKKIGFALCLLATCRTAGIAQPLASAPPQASRTIQAPAPPKAEIGNGVIYARIYLPDPEKGYYRGTRFDWSGVMPSLEYKGHTYCGQWFPEYAPTTHDAVMGPVESFTPLGYEGAAPGGSFVQIGVGSLTRPDGSAYNSFTYYPVRDPGAWQIKRGRASIEFHQQLKDPVYPYIYTKRMELPKNRPELILSHSLKNTGTHTIETEVFDHNFFLIDSQSTGPGLVLKFPFPLTAEGARGLGDLAAIRGDSIVILRQLTGKASVYAILHGYDDQAEDYDIRLENHTTGAGLRIRADRPLSRLVCWGNSTILCPEPYMHIRVPPGETVTWTIRYEFYTVSISNGK